MSSDHLTHGWEPSTTGADSVLRAFVLSTADATTWIAERVGGTVARWDDLAAADPASPVFFDNFAVLLCPPAYLDLDDVLGRLRAFYPPERHFVLLSVWPTPDLTGCGFSLMGHPPFMLRPAGAGRPPVPSELSIVEATDAAALADALAVLGAAFGLPSEGSPAGDPRTLGGPVRVWVGHVDGRAVATAAARIGHGLVDVEAVATLPESQGRGYGEALTWAATLADPDRPAVLYASDAGRAIYERMGYLPLSRLTLWHRPPIG